MFFSSFVSLVEAEKARDTTSVGAEKSEVSSLATPAKSYMEHSTQLPTYCVTTPLYPQTAP